MRLSEVIAGIAAEGVQGVDLDVRHVEAMSRDTGIRSAWVEFRIKIMKWQERQEDMQEALTTSEYAAKLQTLSEPLRSQLLYGDCSPQRS